VVISHLRVSKEYEGKVFIPPAKTGGKLWRVIFSLHVNNFNAKFSSSIVSSMLCFSSSTSSFNFFFFEEVAGGLVEEEEGGGLDEGLFLMGEIFDSKEYEKKRYLVDVS
jgi:hypothetical protein